MFNRILWVRINTQLNSSCVYSNKHWQKTRSINLFLTTLLARFFQIVVDFMKRKYHRADFMNDLSCKLQRVLNYLRYKVLWRRAAVGKLKVQVLFWKGKPFVNCFPFRMALLRHGRSIFVYCVSLFFSFSGLFATVSRIFGQERVPIIASVVQEKKKPMVMVERKRLTSSSSTHEPAIWRVSENPRKKNADNERNDGSSLTCAQLTVTIIW